jgi:hypothetical protein
MIYSSIKVKVRLEVRVKAGEQVNRHSLMHKGKATSISKEAVNVKVDFS